MNLARLKFLIREDKNIFPICSDSLFNGILACAILLVTGCSPALNEDVLPLEPPESFSDVGEEQAPDRWWTSFGDPRLNIMVDSALSANFNLKSVWQQLKVAQAVADRESSFILPDLEGFMQGGVRLPQPDFVGGENFQFGLRSSYEVDLWGRIQANIDAQQFRAQASLLDYKAAAISLSGEIARTWYQLMAAQSQLQLVNEQVETNEKILGLLRNRLGTGQIRSVDILRQKQLLESTRDQKVTIEINAETLENQLSVLVGRSPQNMVNYVAEPLPELPPLPETGIPIDLVRRRPDVQSAFKRLQAADQEVAAAISNKYPRLNLSISTAIRSNDVNDIFQTWARSFAGSIVAPIFYGGRLNAEVDRTEAIKQQLLYDYGQTVLVAFREVEDALVREQKQEKRIDILKEQLKLAGQSYEQLRVQYFNGFSNYLEVLTALNQKQQLRRDMVMAKMNLLEFRISLYRALAGSFETKREAGETGDGDL